MNDIFIKLNNVQSHIITCGDPSDCDGSDVIICIAGNPGITDFYREFATILHNDTRLPVCVIGQAGHENVPEKHSNELQGQENLFNLDGQIQHKLDLINEHIDKRSKLHLIGHSIGSWLILECLKKNDNMLSRIASVNLLFPTVQRMAESRNGRFLNNVVRKVHTFVVLLFMLLDMIPESILRLLVKCYLRICSIPEHFEDSILKFCSTNVGEKVLFLAYNEMDTVRALNCDVIEKIKHKTNVVYSAHDGWAPVHYMEDFKQFQPALTMQRVDFDHAFVLKSSKSVAQIVIDFIRKIATKDQSSEKINE